MKNKKDKMSFSEFVDEMIIKQIGENFEEIREYMDKKSKTNCDVMLFALAYLSQAVNVLDTISDSITNTENEIKDKEEMPKDFIKGRSLCNAGIEILKDFLKIHANFYANILFVKYKKENKGLH
jgi:hypothetical protein